MSVVFSFNQSAMLSTDIQIINKTHKKKNKTPKKKILAIQLRHPVPFLAFLFFFWAVIILFYKNSLKNNTIGIVKHFTTVICFLIFFYLFYQTSVLL
jgi:hypothetical protein